MTVTASIVVNVYIPAWTGHGQGGTMRVDNTYPVGLVATGMDDYLWAGPSATVGPGGMNWTATIAPPSTTSFGAGSLALVQLCNNNATYTDSSNVVHTEVPNGSYGLDTSYPYPWVSTMPTDANYSSIDSPGYDLTSRGAIKATDQTAFQDYLMYTPPANSTYSLQSVPLAMFSWSQHGNATIPSSNNWANFVVGTAGTVAPSSFTTFTPTNQFPSWMQNSGNGFANFP